tara:strand:+ start:21 stop:728 length:708 start_codon:yes stop_codon:yes gene_type:complete
MRRDLAGLVDYGRSLRPDRAIWDQASDLCVLTARDLRRKLDFAELQQIESALSEALNAIRDLLEPVQSQDMSTNEVTNEQHYQNSNKDSYDFEPRLEKAQGEGSVSGPATALVVEGGTDEPVSVDNNLPRIPLGLVLAACSEYRTYAERPVRHWHDLVRVADVIRPMMGVSPSAWEEAKQYMGPEEASVVILAMLERFGDIRSPGGYLRSLSAKAALGEFSCGPMIMALMRKDAA